MTFPFPQPAPTVARSQLVIDWIGSLGWNATPESGYMMHAGPEILTAPDRLLTITPTPGPGWLTDEAALDTWGFQARVRGASDDPLGPELAAQQLDVLIINAPRPAALTDGTVIVLVTRQGSPPTPLPLAPDDRRFEYVCTYLITTGLE